MKTEQQIREHIEEVEKKDKKSNQMLWLDIYTDALKWDDGEEE